jgi:macrodomain Ter protein organizer (MatP/YcbG family)
MPVGRGSRHNIVMDAGSWAVISAQAKRKGISISEHIRRLVQHEAKKQAGYESRDHGGRRKKQAAGNK